MKTAIRYSFFLFALSCAMITDAQELVSGRVIGRHIFGLATDVDGDPLLVGETPLIYGSSNFEQTLTVDDNAFVVSGFGDTLGGLYLTHYSVESNSYIDTASFDLTAVNGLNRPRGGILTPWNSVLFGEAQAVDGANPQGFIDRFNAFYKGKSELVNPYSYGWVADAIILDGQGSAKIIKNYAVGRVFASQLFMMPDGKSLYLFDSENTGLLYLYIAERTDSLTSGALYGISLEDGKVVYDFLGRSSALTMKLKLDKIGFNELFEAVPADSGICPAKFVHVETVYGAECLKVRERNSKYAGLFDPIRLLAILRKGRPLSKFAKVEFRKNQVELSGEDGVSRTYGLGQSANLDSQYIIQEPQQ